MVSSDMSAYLKGLFTALGMNERKTGSKDLNSLEPDLGNSY